MNLVKSEKTPVSNSLYSKSKKTRVKKKVIKRSLEKKVNDIPYKKQIFEYLKKIDNKVKIGLRITPPSQIFFLRTKMIKTILKSQKTFKVSEETFFIAVDLFDRFLAKNSDDSDISNILKEKNENKNLTIPLNTTTKKTLLNPTKEKLKTIALICFFLATKFNEIFSPTLQDVFFSHKFDLDLFVFFEKEILSIVDFNIFNPPYVFYANFILNEIFKNNKMYYKLFLNILIKGVFCNCVSNFDPRDLVFAIFLKIINKHKSKHLENFQKLIKFLGIDEYRLEETYVVYGQSVKNVSKYISITL